MVRLSVGRGPDTGSIASSVLADKVVLDISSDIAYLEPDKAPLLRLLTPSSNSKANLRKEDCKNSTFDWLEDENLPDWDTVHGICTSTTLTVHLAEYWAVGDVAIVPRTGNVYYVSAIGGDGVGQENLTVVRVYGSDDTVDNDPVVILRNTSAEGSASPAMLLNQETKPYNYTEIIKTPFGVTGTLNATELYGGKELDRQSFKKGIDHAKAIERRLLFGRRYNITTGSYNHKFMGGCLYYISTNITTDTSTFTETEWNTWLQTLFTYGDGSKVVLCGATLVAALNVFPSGKIRINDVLTTKYGLNILEWICPFGTAYLVYHRLMSGATYGKMGIGLDMSNIKYRPLRTRDTTLEMNIQAKGTDRIEHQYMTEAGFEMRLEKTHALLNIA